MARLAMCGWESGSVDEWGIQSLRVAAVTASESIQPTARTGRYAFRSQWSSYSNYLANNMRSGVLPSSPNEVWIRLAIAQITVYSYYGTHLHTFLELTDRTIMQIGFGYTSGVPSVLQVFRGVTVIATGGRLPIGATFRLFEAHVIIHGVTGVVQVWLDGILVIDFTGNTLSSDTAQITDIRIGGHKLTSIGASTGESMSIDFDDFAINDTAGTVNNGRIGQGGIIALFPTGDTSAKIFTPSTGTNNYSLVNSVPIDYDTTYVQAGSVGDCDLYQKGNLSVGNIVNAVMPVVQGRTVSGVTAGIALTLRSNSISVISSTFLLQQSYFPVSQLWETDPATNGAWTLTALNSLQVGITVM